MKYRVEITEESDNEYGSTLWFARAYRMSGKDFIDVACGSTEEEALSKLREKLKPKETKIIYIEV